MRLKLKVYTDDGGKRFVAALGMFREDTQRVHAFVMSDEKTREVQLLVEEWNALPYYYFKEDGPAERPERGWPQ